MRKRLNGTIYNFYCLTYIGRLFKDNLSQYKNMAKYEIEKCVL